MIDLEGDIPDDLLLEQSEDPDGVQMALRVARTLWSSGDTTESLRWLRRAAETASDEGADRRSLQLAKTAAELRSKLVPRAAAQVREAAEPQADSEYTLPGWGGGTPSAAPAEAETPPTTPRVVERREGLGHSLPSDDGPQLAPSEESDGRLPESPPSKAEAQANVATRDEPGSPTASEASAAPPAASVELTPRAPVAAEPTASPQEPHQVQLPLPSSGPSAPVPPLPNDVPIPPSARPSSPQSSRMERSAPASSRPPPVEAPLGGVGGPQAVASTAEASAGSLDATPTPPELEAELEAELEPVAPGLRQDESGPVSMPPSSAAPSSARSAQGQKLTARVHHQAVRVSLARDPAHPSQFVVRPLREGEASLPGERTALLVALEPGSPLV